MRQSKSQLLLEARAHGFRQSLNGPEAALWQCLRRQQLGVAFRRQVPLAGRFIADFVAPSVKVIVEVDLLPPPASASRRLASPLSVLVRRALVVSLR
jgi:very-short-patch-repair endonuclease